jgi:hypothetical protein
VKAGIQEYRVTEFKLHNCQNYVRRLVLTQCGIWKTGMDEEQENRAAGARALGYHCGAAGVLFSVSGETLSIPFAQLREGNVVRMVKSKETSGNYRACRRPLRRSADGYASRPYQEHKIHKDRFQNRTVYGYGQVPRHRGNARGQCAVPARILRRGVLTADYAPGDAPVKYYKLKINNPEWKRTLEEILAAAN